MPGIGVTIHDEEPMTFWFGLFFSCLALVYVCVGAMMYFGQRHLVYVPDPEHVPPDEVGLSGVAERVLETPDGEKIVTWYAKARPGQPTLLYFHGNAGNLGSRADRVRRYVASGRGILMMSYRSYSGSSGTPGEAANVADAKLAYDTLLANGVRPDDIVIYGESLGTGVAVQVAEARKAHGLVLDAPYTSLVDLAAELYPWLPVRWLIKDRYEMKRYLSEIATPLLVVHGENDATIPARMGRAVATFSKGPSKFVLFPGAGHADHYLFGSFEVINAWIDNLSARTNAPKS